MKIVVDAMGGDHAPDAIVEGAVAAMREYDIDIVLVGQESVVNESLAKYLPKGDPRMTVEHAEQIVEMTDIPSQIMRGKRNSSIHVGLKLVKDGKADAFFSAGNTGAVMAVALLTLRTMEGIDRPCLATVLPSMKGHTVLLDVGANVDSKPENLLQFAIMGSAYAKAVLGLDSPRVGLQSIGEEDVKGNEQTKTVFAILKENKALNFVGNVEAKELFKGNADVVVCDGFVGNITLKTTEAVAKFIATILKEEIRSSLLSKIGALFMLPGLNRFKKRADYEEYGSAPLLGLNGLVFIGHGSSSPNGVKHSIRIAKETTSQNIIDSIKMDVQRSFELLRKS